MTVGRNVANLSLFYRYYFGSTIGITFGSTIPHWFHFLSLEGGLLSIVIDCMIFLSSFLRMSMSTVSFLA